MNPTFTAELQAMYQKILLQQHNIAYTSMIAAFATAAENADLLTAPTASPFSLDSEIPREDIECDVEFVMVRNLRENFKKLDTSLNGLRGKKYGYREIIEMVSTRQAYPSSPGTPFKRSRASLLESSFDMLSKTMTPPPKDGESEAKKAKLADDTATTLDESNASSHEGNLIIDCSGPSTSSAVAPICDAEKPKENKPVESSDDPSSEDYKPSKLRIERMRNIRKKKPKLNFEKLDLTYNSNMARHFPGSEHRTDDQQARRDKNTIAARISRTKNKAYEDILQSQSLDSIRQNITMKRQIACLRVYANELMKQNGFPDSNLNQMWEANIRDILCASE